MESRGVYSGDLAEENSFWNDFATSSQGVLLSAHHWMLWRMEKFL